MHASIGLMKRIAQMPFPWNVWVVVVGMVNILGGVYYWNTTAGKAAIAAMILAFLIMVVIYSRFGFVRLLGLGHLLTWSPLIVFLAMNLSDAGLDRPFRLWIRSVIVLNGMSLATDLIDVSRVVRGERLPA